MSCYSCLGRDVNDFYNRLKAAIYKQQSVLCLYSACGSAHQRWVTGVVDGGLSPSHAGLGRVGACSGRLGRVELVSLAPRHDLMSECDEQMRSLLVVPLQSHSVPWWHMRVLAFSTVCSQYICILRDKN